MFLPNKIERYTAALRNYIQNSILKKGVSKKHIERIKKITIFEAVNSEKEMVPCDVKSLSSKLLIIIYSKLLEKDVSFDFSVNLRENYVIDVRLFSIVLILLAANSKVIHIEESLGNLIIKCKTELKPNPKLLKALNATVLFEKKSKILLLIISTQKTSKPSVDIKKEWDISNPFSPINLFLS